MCDLTEQLQVSGLQLTVYQKKHVNLDPAVEF